MDTHVIYGLSPAGLHTSKARKASYGLPERLLVDGQKRLIVGCQKKLPMGWVLLGCKWHGPTDHGAAADDSMGLDMGILECGLPSSGNHTYFKFAHAVSRP